MEFQQTLLRQKKPKLSTFMTLNTDSSKATLINKIEYKDQQDNKVSAIAPVRILNDSMAESI